MNTGTGNQERRLCKGQATLGLSPAPFLGFKEQHWSEMTPGCLLFRINLLEVKEATDIKEDQARSVTEETRLGVFVTCREDFGFRMNQDSGCVLA